MYAVKNEKGEWLTDVKTAFRGPATAATLNSDKESAKKFWWEWTAKRAAKKAGTLLGCPLDVVDLDPAPEPELPPAPTHAGLCRLTGILVVPLEAAGAPDLFAPRSDGDDKCRFEATFRRFDIEGPEGDKRLVPTQDAEVCELSLDELRNFHLLEEATLEEWGWQLYHPEVSRFNDNHLPEVWRQKIREIMNPEAWTPDEKHVADQISKTLNGKSKD